MPKITFCHFVFHQMRCSAQLSLASLCAWDSLGHLCIRWRTMFGDDLIALHTVVWWTFVANSSRTRRVPLVELEMSAKIRRFVCLLSLGFLPRRFFLP
jgi:hypothetical protein